MNYWVYILKCSDKRKSLYTGFTNNIVQRIDTHEKGKGAKFTQGKQPLRLVYYERFDDKSLALKREYKIKQMTRTEKIKLILDDGFSFGDDL